MSTPKEKPEPSPGILLARYAGAISRWCSLTGHTPDASSRNKTQAEFEAFEQWLDQFGNDEES